MGKVRENIICYKLLTDKLYSSYTQEKYRLKYSRRVWIRAAEVAISRGYGICVFDTKKRLKEYKRNLFGEFKAFIVACKEEISPLPIHLRDIRDWDPNKYIVSININWPKGTRMFKRIKLLEEIHI